MSEALLSEAFLIVSVLAVIGGFVIWAGIALFDSISQWWGK